MILQRPVFSSPISCPGIRPSISIIGCPKRESEIYENIRHESSALESIVERKSFFVGHVEALTLPEIWADCTVGRVVERSSPIPSDSCFRASLLDIDSRLVIRWGLHKPQSGLFCGGSALGPGYDGLNVFHAGPAR